MKKNNNTPLDERQTQERQRFGFHCFFITCIELCVVLIASMFWYDWINTQLSFFGVLMACLIIPIIYFNIRTKISGVTNNIECYFSIIIAVLYVITLIIGIFSKEISVSNVFFGLLFVINGFIGLVYLMQEKKAEKEDYLETHGKKEQQDKNDK